MSAVDSIPTSTEESVISCFLNSFILFVFLMGMYTVVYFGTIYLYFTKNSSRSYAVPAALTTLFLGNMVQTALQWYATKWQFVNNGDTRQSVFLALFDLPLWTVIILDIANCITFVIADALLIWRCFYVWDRSWRMISLPLFLIFSEFALFLAKISFDAKFGAAAPPNLATKINDVLSTAYFTAFGTTLVTTILIAYRIYSVTKQQGASSRRFKNIIDIVVQSGAVYALSLFIFALAGSLPGLSTLNNHRVAFAEYMQSITFAVGGISSTIMVARVALLSEDTTYPSTSVHLSGLQFHARSTHQTVDVEVMEVTHSVNGNKISAGDDHKAEEKA